LSIVSQKDFIFLRHSFFTEASFYSTLWLN